MGKRKKQLRPYLHRGSPRVTEPRPTSVDPPDPRVPQPHPRRLTAQDLKGIPVPAVHPYARVAHRCFLRWATTPLSDIPPPGYAHVILAKRAIEAYAPLDDAESKIVDAAIRASPGWAQRFVYLWYRQQLPPTEIAKELRMKRREYVYTERDLVLLYYTGRLHEIGFSLKAEAYEA